MTELEQNEALKLWEIATGRPIGANNMLDIIVKLIALARQRPGWVWVPEKASEEMLYAGHHKIDFHRNEQRTDLLEHDSQTAVDDGMGGKIHAGSTIKQDMLEAWSAMLAAAPKPGEKP